MMMPEPMKIAALLERLGRLLATDAFANGLQPVHWEALRYLERANRFSKTSAALTAYLGITKGTVSQTLKALESRDLVRRRQDRKDKRRFHLGVTAKGRRLLAADPLAKTREVISALSAGEQDDLAGGLETLLRLRLAEDGRQRFGMCRDCVYFAARHAEGSPHFCRLLRESLTGDDASAICVEQQPKPAAADDNEYASPACSRHEIDPAYAGIDES